MQNRYGRGLLTSFGLGMLICTLLLTSCAPVQPTYTTQATNQLTRVNVCYTTTAATQVLSWYAQQNGIFAHYGLDVNLVLINGGGAKMVAAMLAGDVDFCQTGGGAIVNAAVAGAEVVLVAGLFNTQLYSLMVQSTIQEAADLKGKILAIGSVGASSDLMTRLALQRLNLQPDQDVTLLSVGQQQERLALMASGQVAGTLVIIPETIKAKAMGYNELLDLSTLNIPQTSSTLASTKSYLAANPATATAFMQAILTAIAQMKQDEAGTKKALADFLDLDSVADASLLDTSYRVIIQQHLAAIPYVPDAAIQADLDLLVQENPAAANFQPADFVDMRILHELEATGFIGTLYKP